MRSICESMATRASNVGQIHVGGKFAHGQISLIVRTNWGLEVTPEASTAPWGWLLHVGGCPGARFMRSICESMTMRGSNVGQLQAKSQRRGRGKFGPFFAGIGAWK